MAASKGNVIVEFYCMTINLLALSRVITLSHVCILSMCGAKFCS